MLSLLQNPQSLLSAILFGNMLVNVMFFSLSFVITVSIAEEVSHTAAAVSGVVSLFAVILFGEVSPKGIAVGRPQRFAELVAPVLIVWCKIARPVSAILRRIASGLTEFLHARLPRVPYVTSEELKMLVGLAEQQGVLESEARGMIEQVVELANIRLNEVMTPRVDAALHNIADERKTLCAMIRERHEEHVAVYEGSMDNIIGILVSRHVFMYPERDVRSLLKPVHFVPETQTVERLLERFRETDEPVVVVVDEFGGTAGIVDKEHLMEEIVGEIRDEFEPAEEPVVQLDEDTYLLAGDLNTRDWSALLGSDFDWPGVETVGGLVVALMGRIPRVGEGMSFRGLWFTVEKMSGNRVELVRVERMAENE